MKERLLQGVFSVFMVSGYELNSPVKATRVTTLELLERSVRSAFRRSNQFEVSAGSIIITDYPTKHSTTA
jgi:hypothetical protein